MSADIYGRKPMITSTEIVIKDKTTNPLLQYIVQDNTKQIKDKTTNPLIQYSMQDNTTQCINCMLDNGQLVLRYMLILQHDTTARNHKDIL